MDSKIIAHYGVSLASNAVSFGCAALQPLQQAHFTNELLEINEFLNLSAGVEDSFKSLLTRRMNCLVTTARG
jgi:hypothetical protein